MADEPRVTRMPGWPGGELRDKAVQGPSEDPPSRGQALFEIGLILLGGLGGFLVAWSILDLVEMLLPGSSFPVGMLMLGMALCALSIRLVRGTGREDDE
ncbi:MAG: hypothetical protein ACRDTZ_15105 [Pseudonocardiaceae bacterium]